VSQSRQQEQTSLQLLLRVSLALSFSDNRATCVVIMHDIYWQSTVPWNLFIHVQHTENRNPWPCMVYLCTLCNNNNHCVWRLRRNSHDVWRGHYTDEENVNTLFSARLDTIPSTTARTIYICVTLQHI